MIDTHCHLEQPDYDKDRHLLIERCRKNLQAVIMSCANPSFIDLTFQLVRKYKHYIFATASIHPSYVKNFNDEDVEQYINCIRSSKEDLVAIGETGLDYNFIREREWKEKQKKLFQEFIDLAKEMHLPLVIHSRDATQDVIEILKENTVNHVQMHMFTNHSFLKQALDKHWLISVNTLLLRSKNIKKIVRDCPIEQLMLETDSPWLGIGKDGNIKPKDEVRNEPTAVHLVMEKIAEIKKIDILEVDLQTTRNAKDFFNLPLAKIPY